MSECPHCGGGPNTKLGHVCEDRGQWTQAERDKWRAMARKRNPRIQFAPSTAVMQDRFGARNRADREKEQR